MSKVNENKRACALTTQGNRIKVMVYDRHTFAPIGFMCLTYLSVDAESTSEVNATAYKTG